MTKDQMIEELARIWERNETSGHGWTDEQFEIWWSKDPNGVHNRLKQQARARTAYQYFTRVIQGEIDFKK